MAEALDVVTKHAKDIEASMADDVYHLNEMKVLLSRFRAGCYMLSRDLDDRLWDTTMAVNFARGLCFDRLKTKVPYPLCLRDEPNVFIDHHVLTQYVSPELVCEIRGILGDNNDHLTHMIMAAYGLTQLLINRLKQSATLVSVNWVTGDNSKVWVTDVQKM